MDDDGSSPQGGSRILARLKQHKALSIGISAGLLTALAVVIIALDGSTEPTKAESATLALERTSKALTETAKIDRAVHHLELGEPDTAAKYAAAAVGGLGSSENENLSSYPKLDSGLKDSLAAGNDVLTLAGSLKKAANLLEDSATPNVSLLQSESTTVSELAGQELKVDQNMERAYRRFQQVLNASVTVLKKENVYSSEAKHQAQAAREAIQRGTIYEGKSNLDRRMETAIASVETSLRVSFRQRSTVTGPHDCGRTEITGTQIVVNSGDISCETAISVVDNSSGPNSASGPPGWDCSSSAVTLQGSTVGASGGYSCINGPVQLSFYLPGAAEDSVTESEGGTEHCDTPPEVSALTLTGGSTCEEATSITGQWIKFDSEMKSAGTIVHPNADSDSLYMCDPEPNGLINCVYSTSLYDGGVKDPGRTISFVD